MQPITEILAKLNQNSLSHPEEVFTRLFRYIMYNNARNSLEMRLKAKVCELCGSTDAQAYQIHHIHKVKDLK